MRIRLGIVCCGLLAIAFAGAVAATLGNIAPILEAGGIFAYARKTGMLAEG